ncbi:MAG: sulfur carrier protein ThiS [Streptosporangiales bacterium]|nr:sulfur carrier protein ThiS [Streptosporangiales bacterium]
MKVVVNGTPHEFDEDATVATVVRSFTHAPSGVAVAVNDAVVSRGDWETTALHDDDRIEVLTAVQGG